MRVMSLLACLAMTVLTAAGARAATTVQVVDTWPAGDKVELGSNQTFYIHVRYHSDSPTHFWAAPHGDNGPVRAGTNPSRVYPAGDGEALVWFFLMQPGEHVTGVRINAGDGSTAGTHEIADYPVDVSAGNGPPTAAAQPEWLTRLRAEDQAAQDAAYRKAMSEPIPAGDMAFFSGFMLLMLAVGLFGTLAPAWGLWRWRGGWRIAAAVPAAVMAFVVLRIVIDGMRDPTSHNLWPFEILTWGTLSSLCMIALLLLHKIRGAARA